MKNYPLTHKDEYLPKYLETYVKNIPKYYTQKFPSPLHLKGTHDHPLFLDGIYYTDKDIYLEGFYRGKGIIFSKSGNIHITDDLIAKDKDNDMLTLIAPKGKVILHKNTSLTKIEACICVRNSILRGRGVEVRGNLVTKNLNREGLEEGIFKLSKMPKIVHITYDARIRNRNAEHLHPIISTTPLYLRY